MHPLVLSLTVLHETLLAPMGTVLRTTVVVEHAGASPTDLAACLCQPVARGWKRIQENVDEPELYGSSKRVVARYIDVPD